MYFILFAIFSIVYQIAVRNILRGIEVKIFSSSLYSSFHSLSLYIPFTLSLSFLSLPLSISLLLPFSLSLSPSRSLLSIILFGVSNGRFRPCDFYNYMCYMCLKCNKHVIFSKNLIILGFWLFFNSKLFFSGI